MDLLKGTALSRQVRATHSAPWASQPLMVEAPIASMRSEVPGKQEFTVDMRTVQFVCFSTSVMFLPPLPITAPVHEALSALALPAK